jgi:LAO/AO transport system kinase
MLNLDPRADTWRPPILKTIATTGEGIPEVVEAIRQHRAYLVESGEKAQRERARMQSEVLDILRHTLLERALNNVAGERLEKLIDRVAARELDPYSAARHLMERIRA